MTLTASQMVGLFGSYATLIIMGLVVIYLAKRDQRRRMMEEMED